MVRIIEVTEEDCFWLEIEQTYIFGWYKRREIVTNAMDEPIRFHSQQQALDYAKNVYGLDVDKFTTDII